MCRTVYPPFSHSKPPNNISALSRVGGSCRQPVPHRLGTRRGVAPLNVNSASERPWPGMSFLAPGPDFADVSGAPAVVPDAVGFGCGAAAFGRLAARPRQGPCSLRHRAGSGCGGWPRRSGRAIILLALPKTVAFTPASRPAARFRHGRVARGRGAWTGPRIHGHAGQSGSVRPDRRAR